jgi:hypothetical protein
LDSPAAVSALRWPSTAFFELTAVWRRNRRGQVPGRRGRRARLQGAVLPPGAGLRLRCGRAAGRGGVKCPGGGQRLLPGTGYVSLEPVPPAIW